MHNYVPLCKYVHAKHSATQLVGGAVMMYSVVKLIFLVVILPLSWQQEQCQKGMYPWLGSLRPPLSHGSSLQQNNIAQGFSNY